jgi:hypothetical protein
MFTMMYSTVLQKFKWNSLYSGLHKKDKFWEILRFSNLTLFTTSDLKICHFYAAQNTQYFVLIFCTQLKSIIIYFFETSYFQFSKGLKNGLHRARASNWRSCAIFSGKQEKSACSMAVVQKIQGLFDLKDFQGYFWGWNP